MKNFCNNSSIYSYLFLSFEQMPLLFCWMHIDVTAYFDDYMIKIVVGKEDICDTTLELTKCSSVLLQIC